MHFLSWRITVERQELCVKTTKTQLSVVRIRPGIGLTVHCQDPEPIVFILYHVGFLNYTTN